MSREQKQRALAGAIVVAVAVFGWLMFRPSYGEIGPAAYDYSVALFAVLNGKDEDRLADVSRRIDGDYRAGRLNDREYGWLSRIIAMAEEGDRSGASAENRTLMEAQIRD